MGLEIERRFLVRTTAWQSLVRTSVHLSQGYISISPHGVTTRVRHDHAKGWLTLKAPVAAGAAPATGPIRRWEFEYAIPLGDAKCLLDHCPHQLRKERHTLNLAGGDWVVDCFADANHGLVLAEVEVELERPDAGLCLPRWLGPEVTGNGRLSNAALARHPWSQWLEQEKQALWR
ncbi:MAG: CYTH domain-containing protein [Synechococcus sp. SB0668_bin_15]|nr:CYTH domain-containing protein [Synechococcus sp. SB0668_bin_15]MXZ83915.1 CYTH domain-containing protein [Synechococcus sp. SB0666_bin_14]MYA91448.1 CYTH domain-containing protein [Synechococcus sp. SB0663_bin_10]MYC48951.1 CYTH domain-containing protein [Synechococcus sp. SB0662_bin_14]MYG46835.1 CYTH domain-containing protein [Synechococcus sp. SB0675_bin_6]MYJ58996.1 CYTH domain-containing protein [Synechococcus sp. SB0672_bin_6]MYK91092.1 CYTH domain-containing protein [Synechococcus 